MKLKVPFYKSKKDTDCGPLALKMALEYFGEKHSFNKILKLEKPTDAGLVWSVGIARAARKLGFLVEFFSISNFKEEDNIDYYKKYANYKAKIILKELIDELKEFGVELQEKNLSLNELLSYVSKESIPIVLVNWYSLVEKEGFNGHFLLVTGYDKENVYVHNPGIADAMPYLPIKKEKFVKAWESKGTDKDTIVIRKKKK